MMVELFIERWTRVCQLEKIIRNGRTHEKVGGGQVWLGKAESPKGRKAGCIERASEQKGKPENRSRWWRALRGEGLGLCIKGNRENLPSLLEYKGQTMSFWWRKYQINKSSACVWMCVQRRNDRERHVGAMLKDLRLDVTSAKMQAGFAVSWEQHLWNLRTESSRGERKLFHENSAAAWSNWQRPWKEAGNSVSKAGWKKRESWIFGKKRETIPEKKKNRVYFRR